MKTLEKEIIVTKNDLDHLNHVNNIVYIEWILSIAKDHWRNLVSNEILKNYYWVLLEHNIKYLLPTILNDKLRLSTYVEKTELVKSHRIVNIYNSSTNKLIAISKTQWCLINAKTNKPSRIPVEIRSAFN
ncbi:MAG: acyl-CoA thioesterase [Flavobacteriaceae bacterium]